MSTKSDSLSRRTLLRGLGVSMALPWLESLSFAAGEQRCHPLHADGKHAQWRADVQD